MTLAAEPMTRKVIVAPPELPLPAAWAVMRREYFRHLPIVAAGRLIGILSDRDILALSTLDNDELVVPDMPAGEAATLAPYVCNPTTTVSDVVRMLIDKKIDAAPVVDDDGDLVGLVTSTDLMRLLIRLDEAKLPLPFVFEVEQVPMAA